MLDCVIKFVLKLNVLYSSDRLIGLDVSVVTSDDEVTGSVPGTSTILNVN